MKKHPIILDLEKRKTAKRYDPTRRVPREQMDVLYEALRLSASSINSQPWKFIVLESIEAKARMAETFVNMFEYNKRQVIHSSHVILLAHNPHYTIEDYRKVVEVDISNNRTNPESRETALAKYDFTDLYTDEFGNNSAWTKTQLYLALGNALHTLARLNIDATPMEGVDSKLIGEKFKQELDDYICEVALAVGYHHEDDFNSKLPKSRLPKEDIIKII